MKIAISGDGRVSRRHVIDTLEQAVERGATLIIGVPVDLEQDSSSAARYAADWAIDNSVDFEVCVPAKKAHSSYVGDLIEASAERHATSNVGKVVNSDDEIYLAWDDNDENCMRVLMSAHEQGVHVYDLTNGNDAIVVDDEEEEEIELTRGTPTVGGDRDDLEVYVDNREVMKRVQRVLDRAMGDVQSILSEYIESAPAPRKNRRSTRFTA